MPHHTGPQRGVLGPKEMALWPHGKLGGPVDDEAERKKETGLESSSWFPQET